MERDRNITTIKKDDEDKRMCGICANRLSSGYCSIINNYVFEDDLPENFDCQEYQKKSIKIKTMVRK